jgi:hypothetical protein
MTQFQEFLRVEVNINPFTFKVIKKNKKEFIDDKMVQELLNNAKYLDFKNGYLFTVFQGKFLVDDDSEVIKEAKKIIEEVKQAVIRMHKYVIKIIDRPAFTIRIK